MNINSNAVAMTTLHAGLTKEIEYAEGIFDNETLWAFNLPAQFQEAV
jgi:hypothetical protein